MASPINEAHAKIKALEKEVNRLTRKVDEQKQLIELNAMLAKAEVKKALIVAARWELRASMTTSLFAAELKHVADDVENARTLSELKSWIKNDLLQRWDDFLISAEQLNDMTQADWEDKAQSLTESAGIRFSKESIQRNMKEIMTEYGI